MSYARWSNSAWYAFYNVNGKLSLWYDLDHTFDWEYEPLVDLMQYEDEFAITELVITYNCTREEASEAILYIKRFIEEYDPKDKVEYQKEVDELLNKWSEDGNA